MKPFWHASLMVNSFVILPITFIFFIYSTGAMVLLGNWKLFLLGTALFAAGVVLQWTFGLLVEG